MVVTPAWMTSRLYYCNSLHGTSLGNNSEITASSNPAAHVLLGAGRFELATPLLKELHWLNIQGAGFDF